MMFSFTVPRFFIKAGHKYISRERKGNKWVYTYADSKAPAPSAKKDAQAQFRLDNAHLSADEHRAKAAELARHARYAYDSADREIGASENAKYMKLGAVAHAQSKQHLQMADEKQPRKTALPKMPETRGLTEAQILEQAQDSFKEGKKKYKADDTEAGTLHYRHGHDLTRQAIAGLESKGPDDVLGTTASGKPITFGAKGAGYTEDDHRQAHEFHQKLLRNGADKSTDVGIRSDKAMRAHAAGIRDAMQQKGTLAGIGNTSSGKVIAEDSHLRGKSDHLTKEEHAEASLIHQQAAERIKAANDKIAFGSYDPTHKKYRLTEKQKQAEQAAYFHHFAAEMGLDAAYKVTRVPRPDPAAKSFAGIGPGKECFVISPLDKYAQKADLRHCGGK